MNIEQKVKQAINEFGKFAHERFIVYRHNENAIDALSNEHLDSVLNESPTRTWRSIIKLKPLPELFAHGVKFYGLENELLMWQLSHDYNENDEDYYWVNCNLPLDFNLPLKYRRKNSAALKFDIDRAKAGDAVVVLHGCEWVDFDSCGCKVNWDYPDVDYSDYKMKYPKKAAK